MEDWVEYCFCPVSHSVWNSNLANNIWTVSDRALIFYTSNFSDNFFSVCTNIWVWLIFDKFNLATLITFDKWVLELWYFIYVFLMKRTFNFTQWPWTLSFAYFMKSARTHFTWVFLVAFPLPFREYQHYLSCVVLPSFWEL